MDPKTTKDILDLTKQSISTFYNIGQMARYMYLYTLGKELQKDSPVQVSESGLSQNRDKMIKYTCLAGLGILGLFAFGISALQTREETNRMIPSHN